MNTRNPRRVANAEGSNLADDPEHTSESQDAAIRFRGFISSPYVQEHEGFQQLWKQVGIGTVHKRLKRANIRSLPGLYKWFRERYPEFYYQRHSTGITGKEFLRRVWAAFLELQE